MASNKALKLSLISVAGIAVVAILTIGALVILNQPKETAQEPAEAPAKDKTKPSITSASANYLFAGTTFWGRHTNENARASALGTAYPFSQLASLQRENYDAWIAGLECPITDRGHNKAEEEEIFKFNCDPDYLEHASKYFDAFLLGNNHAGNQGADGLIQTREYLAQHGIQYFGTPKRTANDPSDPEHGNDAADASNCDVVVLPVKAIFSDNSEKSYQIPFGFCSAHGVYGIPGEDFIQNIADFAEILPTIAMPHMGAEYEPSHDQIRQNLYRRMIDLGADSVIADHPHWAQDAEAYNDRLIVYSLGNFMFDQIFNSEVSRSAVIQAQASFSAADLENLAKWHKLGSACLKDKSTCLENIQKAELTKLNITWRYGFQATTSAGDRITRLASEAEQQSMADRLDWRSIPDSMKIQN